MASGLESHRQRLIDEVLPEPSMTGPQVAEAVGLGYAEAQKVWRALGMPHIEDDVVAFSQIDVRSLILVKSLLDSGFSMDAVVSVARVLGQSMSRITDAQTRMVRDRLIGNVNLDDEQVLHIDDAAPLIDALRDSSSLLLDHIYRLHLKSALQRLSFDEDHAVSETLAVGFVDLVGFSRISDDLGEIGLSDLISRFEEIVVQVCTDADVRLVKIVGDAAMFVSTRAAPSQSAAAGILRQLRADGSLPEGRAGLDFGPVLPKSGDYFGRPVNVAARITAFARNGTVVASRAFIDALDEPTVALPTKVGSRRLKDVGRVTLYKMALDAES
ncbi:MAG: adenylate cyclase regulatory domain-containing protein [Actinomycetota bacterium]|nr:adenylate/guanylate cyclase domain-containing protein [Actinomycetota bacterium]